MPEDHTGGDDNACKPMNVQFDDIPLVILDLDLIATDKATAQRVGDGARNGQILCGTNVTKYFCLFMHECLEGALDYLNIHAIQMQTCI